MTGIIIMAAGSSSRMGKTKQNLLYRGKTLLQTAVRTALQCNCEAVAVVLGANADEITPTLMSMPIHFILNKNWREGLGTSISCGLSGLSKLYPNMENVIFLLADQPLTDKSIIENLISLRGEEKIIASSYNNTLGPPVLFNKSFFNDLLEMKGNEGAKKVIAKYPGSVTVIPFAPGSLDVDTPEDYQRLLNAD